MLRVVFLFLLCFTLARVDAAEPPAQKFVVFFQEWSARLDDSALAVVRHVRSYSRAHPDVVMHVEGFADPTGSRTANALLTDLRAQVVMDQLHTDGVPASRIQGRSGGAVRFALSSQQSRRVEISLGGH